MIATLRSQSQISYNEVVKDIERQAVFENEKCLSEQITRAFNILLPG
jgi:hypothetical protein